MSLDALRKKIDRIDDQLLSLLSERLEIALRTRKLKPAVRDPGREQTVISRLAARASGLGLLSGGFVEPLFARIIEESRRVQERPFELIGFQGEHGAFGEAAARRFRPDLVTIPCPQFGDVFEGVGNGQLEFGIVPVENSLAGPVTLVNELLIETSLKVVGAVRHRVSHCLLALQDTPLGEVEKVYSHPQALSQCRAFLAAHRLEGVPYYDTAGAARMLASERPKRSAVIADSLCAGLYNLDVLRAGIEDHPLNFTRFLVIAREPAPAAGAKHSLIFTVQHRAGSLFAVLRLFAEANINLTRIESFPFRSDPGAYLFFLDFLTDAGTPAAEDILAKVREKTTMFKDLGSYDEEVCP